MSRSYITLLLIGITAGVNSGCSTTGFCERHSEQCDGVSADMASAPFVVTPPRIGNSMGGKITISNGPTQGDVWLRQGSPVVQINLGALSGSMQTDFSIPTDIRSKGFTVAAAQVAVVRNGMPDLIQPVWISRDPDFSKPALSRVISNDNDGNYDTPVWVGITSTNRLIVLNYYEEPLKKQRTNAYVFTGTAIAPAPNPTAYSAYRFDASQGVLPVGALLTVTTLVLAGYESQDATNHTRLTNCPLTGPCPTTTTAKVFAKISSLVADPQGGLFVGVFDSKLRMFSDAALSSEVTRSEGSNPNGSAVPAVLAVGDINGDGKPDIVCFYAAGKVTVYLHNSSDKNLMYDGAYSTAIESKLLGTTPTASAAGDLDGDPWHDLVLVNGTSLSWLINQGNGKFATSNKISLSAAATSVALGAAGQSSDKVADIALVSSVVTPSVQSAITVFENNASP